MADEGTARVGGVCSLQQPERPSREWGVKTPCAPAASKSTTGVGGARESREHGSRELRREVKMQRHTRGGQCGWRNVTGGRLVCADGVRLGPAGQGTADISDGVGGQSHPRRADGWSRAGGPSAILGMWLPRSCLGPSGRQRARGLPPGTGSLDPTAPGPGPPAQGRTEVSGQEACTQLTWGGGLLSRGQLAASWKETLPPGGGWESTLGFRGYGRLINTSLRGGLQPLWRTLVRLWRCGFCGITL